MIERLHQSRSRFMLDPTPSLVDDVALIVAEHGKGCVVGPAGACPECTLFALQSIELRLLMEETP